jgi:uncharacterized protein (TIGR00255 family)
MSRSEVKSSPVRSMTGFAGCALDTRAGTLHIELRSVNARFLDLVCRLPDELRSLEAGLRETLSAQLQRGKIECRVQWQRADPSEAPPRLNPAIVERLAALQAQVREHMPDTPGLRMRDILDWPGAIESTALTPAELHAAGQQLGQQGLDALQQTRAREGQRLADLIADKVGRMRRLIVELEPQLPIWREQYEHKATQRIAESFSRSPASEAFSHDGLSQRIQQEVGLYGLRADVSEELERLRIHLGEVERILQQGGPVGKRLDFLLQELNREANTLGAKAAALQQTQTAVELKLLIEQIREQVQNLE